jgi:prephenate dehydrogenase
MNVLVVGAGSMGKWFARTLGTQSGVAVAFTDTDSEAATRAAEEVGDRAVQADTDDDFDVVCLAVPMPVVAEAIETYAPLATGAVVDITGSMADPLAAMEAIVPDRERASLHPLFAPENAPGSIAVVTASGGEWTERITDALSGAGNDPFDTTPEEHDRAMESVQSGAHAAVLAYALAVEDVPEQFHTPISSELESLAEDVLDGDARVYADIQRVFDGADAVADAAERIADADHDEFTALYDALS